MTAPSTHRLEMAGAGPLDDARAQLRRAVRYLGYDDSVYDMLAVARRELSVSIPLRRDDGQVEVLTGHRVQHNLSRAQARAAYATARTSVSTRSARSRCG